MKRFFPAMLGVLCCCQLLIGLYVLRLQNGVLRWYDGEKGQWHEASCNTDLLPARDRELLTQGLTFDTRAELTRALEDFCS